MKQWVKIATATLALAVSMSVHAQKWPEKTITIVVPYPPGGNVDSAARIIGAGLQDELGQTVIVENKGGAGGMIGVTSVVKAAPDGYTILLGANGPILYSPIIFGRNAYKWDKDLTAISPVSFTPLVLQINPNFPAKNVADFVVLAKKGSANLTMASPGAGTTNHLLSEQLQSALGTQWTTVHYKGNAPATFDLIGGQVDFGFDQVSVALPYIKQGKLRALAVTSSKRLPSLPDVPTFTEAGIKGMEASTFTGLMAPAGTPTEVVTKLNAAVAKVLQKKEVIQKFDALGAEVRSSSPEEFFQFLKKEEATWVPVIKRANIKAE